MHILYIIMVIVLHSNSLKMIIALLIHILKSLCLSKLLRYYKKGLNNWIELYNNDSFKTKREKKRMNYYINKLNEFERLLND